jgi:hypothetical protein
MISQQGSVISQQGMPISQQENENATRANEFATSQRGTATRHANFASFLTAKFVVLFLTLIHTIVVGLIGEMIFTNIPA